METLQELWDAQDHWRDTISAKLRGYLDNNQTRNLDRCGREKVFRTCTECGDYRSFGYHCDLKWCPRCQHRITARRLKLLRQWISHIEQPKHLVTTQRNFQHLLPRTIREHTANLSKLRRTKVWEKVKGGCVSVEITNESRGWHLHAHWLVDARWVDAAELAQTWGRLVGQDEGAIVKVKDVRGSSYVAEVSKYVCKGSDIAEWPPEEIVQFLHAIRGKRFFFTFGSLFQFGRQVRAQLNKDREHQTCDCGCSKFIWRDELHETLNDIRQQSKRSSRSR